ncbi:MAG TPA: phosphatidylserine/phosphatidylglycerophosphate/cardiolipin synthase family protein, partial [Candidatus Ozemobacteraceae bacterium]
MTTARRRSLIVIGIAAMLGIGAFAAEADPIEVYFGPGGGFAAGNRERAITRPDGSLASATLSQALIEQIDAAQPGSRLKICSYSMSEMPTLDALVRAADRGVQVRLLLDAAAEWTADSREKIIRRLRGARDAARKENRTFDVQVRFVTAQTMRDRNRAKTLRDGRTIVGTMHEKFGLFYPPGSPVPIDGFCGSANISPTSDQIYAENRVFFKNRPVVLRQLQEEFARLWNEYGVTVFGPSSSESFIPVDAPAGDVAILFNAEPVDETALTRIDEALLRMIRSVTPSASGSLDLVMFSLTDRELATAILDQAARCPAAKFRLLLDMGQIDDSNPESSIMAPGLEREIASRGLKNVEIRYKWRSNAVGFDPEKQEIGLVSFRNLFLHHKVLVVDKSRMAMGSYNWSGAGEDMNFEDVMLFDGRYPDHQPVIDRFLAEVDTVWNSRRPAAPPNRPLKNVPQTVTGPEGRELLAKTIRLLRDPIHLAIVQRLDRGAFATFDQLREVA